MASFTAGTTFSDGVANDVTAAKLGVLVTNATPTSGFIQDRTAETVIASNDTVLIGDASDSNNLKRITVANFAQTLPTAKITTGTIETGTFGTTTSTAATITTGTIPTLVATTLVTTGTGSAAAPAIVPTGDTNTGIFFPAADTIAFSEGGTESMRIDSSGNVGIGVVTPISSLHIKNATPVSKITLEDSSTNRIGQIAGGSDGSGGYLAFSAGNNGGSISERLRIDSSGNVGIGTASPSGPLHIRGATGRYAFPATSGTTQSSGLTLRLNDASDDNAILDIGGNSTSGYWLQVTNNANLATNYPLLLNPNGGNVGIGGTPSTLLHLQSTSPSLRIQAASGNSGALDFYRTASINSGQIASESTNALVFSTNTSTNSGLAERLRIDSSGNVGVGTTADSGKRLHIKDTSYAYLKTESATTGQSVLELTNNSGANNFSFGIDSSTGGALTGVAYGRAIYSNGAYPICIITNATERLRIDSSGNVGIGTTGAVNKLEIVGSFGRGAPITKTGDFTLADTENWLIVNKGSSCTVTLPAASSWTGREFTIKVITAHTVVSASSNVVPRNSATAGTAILAATAGSWATLVSNGTNWVIMCGS